MLRMRNAHIFLTCEQYPTENPAQSQAHAEPRSLPGQLSEPTRQTEVAPIPLRDSVTHGPPERHPPLRPHPGPVPPSQNARPDYHHQGPPHPRGIHNLPNPLNNVQHTRTG